MNLCFNLDIAKKVGTNSATILNNIVFWINNNKKNNINYYDGYYWTYNSVKKFKKIFPHLSIKQIRNSLLKLERSGFIKTCNYNKRKYDKTKWYTINNPDICKIYKIMDNNTQKNKTNKELLDNEIMELKNEIMELKKINISILNQLNQLNKNNGQMSVLDTYNDVNTVETIINSDLPFDNNLNIDGQMSVLDTYNDVNTVETIINSDLPFDNNLNIDGQMSVLDTYNDVNTVETIINSDLPFDNNLNIDGQMSVLDTYNDVNNNSDLPSNCNLNIHGQMSVLDTSSSFNNFKTLKNSDLPSNRNLSENMQKLKKGQISNLDTCNSIKNELSRSNHDKHSFALEGKPIPDINLYKTVIQQHKITQDNSFVNSKIEKNKKNVVVNLVNKFNEKYNANFHYQKMTKLVSIKGLEVLEECIDICDKYINNANSIESIFYDFCIKYNTKYAYKQYTQYKNMNNNKPIQATNYEQRKYDDAFFENLYDNDCFKNVL